MKQILLVIALTISFKSLAQITFVDPNTSWEELSKTAKKGKKLIFIQLESSECEHCNEVASQGFNGAVLKDVFQKNFVAIRTRVETENGRKLAEKLHIKGALVALYTDPDGNVLTRYNGSTSQPEAYLEQAQVALSRRNGKQLTDFEKEYQNGEKSAAFLKAFIQKRREINMPTHDLLDEYVGKLPVDSISNFHVIKFIYQQGPTMDSRAYKLVQALAPHGMVDSLYKSVSPAEKVAFNNGIIGNTLRKAVETKNSQLAHQAGYYTQQTYHENYQLGMLQYRRNVLWYYQQVKDTASYFGECRQFIEQNYMLMTVDSLKRMDEAALQKSLAAQTPFGPAGEKQAVRFAPPSQQFHHELNDHAWRYYLWNNQPRDLERALMWSKRSMEWHEELRKDKNHLPLGNPAYMDTYAHLLYKLGRKNEAIEWQTKAVEAQKVSGMSWVSMEKDLNEMKSGTLKR
ncbi:hypothetical protein [Dyadobacter beijingensis]|nr:hypothetical protein [Dyadobacter beijingensis]